MVALLVQVFLSITIHNRTEADYEKHGDTRWFETVEKWVKEGYFKSGGLWFLEGKWKPREPGNDENAYSGESAHPFRRKVITCSDSK